MAKVCGRNVNVDFNYCIKTVILFMSRIVNKLSAFHKILFTKLEKGLKCFVKFDAYIKFLKWSSSFAKKIKQLSACTL